MEELSHPVWVRGLKQQEMEGGTAGTSSHPVWVRGLKLFASPIILESSLSHPVWVRGLKHSVGIDRK